jgi:hypothetical protein
VLRRYIFWIALCGFNIGVVILFAVQSTYNISTTGSTTA